jgi:hypothetical protein
MLQTYSEQCEKQDASFNSVVDKNATMSRETRLSKQFQLHPLHITLLLGKASTPQDKKKCIKLKICNFSDKNENSKCCTVE